MESKNIDLGRFRNWAGGKASVQASVELDMADATQDSVAKAKALKEKAHALIYQNPPRRTKSQSRMLFETKMVTENFWAVLPDKE